MKKIIFFSVSGLVFKFNCFYICSVASDQKYELIFRHINQWQVKIFKQ